VKIPRLLGREILENLKDLFLSNREIDLLKAFKELLHV
jgi:hypothetical protein